MNLSQIKGTVDPILTTMAQGFIAPEKIGHIVAAKVPVYTPSGKFFKFGKEGIKIYDTTRAKNGMPNHIDLEASTDSYLCDEHSLESLIDKTQELKPAEQYGTNAILQLRRRKALLVSSALSTKFEKAVADILFNASNYHSDVKIGLTGTNKFSDYTNSNPIGVIDTGKEAAALKMGVEPNTAVMSYATYRKLKNHPKITAYLSSTERKNLNEEKLAEILELDRVLVGKSMYASDAGVASRLWADGKIALIYLPENPELIEGVPLKIAKFDLEGYPIVREFDRDYVIALSEMQNWQVKNVSDENGYLIYDAI